MSRHAIILILSILLSYEFLHAAPITRKAGHFFQILDKNLSTVSKTSLVKYKPSEILFFPNSGEIFGYTIDHLQSTGRTFWLDKNGELIRKLDEFEKFYVKGTLLLENETAAILFKDYYDLGLFKIRFYNRNGIISTISLNSNSIQLVKSPYQNYTPSKILYIFFKDQSIVQGFNSEGKRVKSFTVPNDTSFVRLIGNHLITTDNSSRKGHIINTTNFQTVSINIPSGASVHDRFPFFVPYEERGFLIGSPSGKLIVFDWKGKKIWEKTLSKTENGKQFTLPCTSNNGFIAVIEADSIYARSLRVIDPDGNESIYQKFFQTTGESDVFQGRSKCIVNDDGLFLIDYPFNIGIRVNLQNKSVLFQPIAFGATFSAPRKIGNGVYFSTKDHRIHRLNLSDYTLVHTNIVGPINSSIFGSDERNLVFKGTNNYSDITLTRFGFNENIFSSLSNVTTNFFSFDDAFLIDDIFISAEPEGVKKTDLLSLTTTQIIETIESNSASKLYAKDSGWLFITYNKVHFGDKNSSFSVNNLNEEGNLLNTQSRTIPAGIFQKHGGFGFNESVFPGELFQTRTENGKHEIEVFSINKDGLPSLRKARIKGITQFTYDDLIIDNRGKVYTVGFNFRGTKKIVFSTLDGKTLQLEHQFSIPYENVSNSLYLFYHKFKNGTWMVYQKRYSQKVTFWSKEGRRLNEIHLNDYPKMTEGWVVTTERDQALVQTEGGEVLIFSNQGKLENRIELPLR